MDPNEGQPREDWPLLEDSLRSIINQPSSPTELEAKCSKTKFRSIKQILKMPKDKLRNALLKECETESRFIQSQGPSNPRDQKLYKPSTIATQFLALNDLKPLKSVRFSQGFCDHLCKIESVGGFSKRLDELMNLICSNLFFVPFTEIDQISKSAVLLSPL